jgi:hypothetical protein
MLRKVFLFTLLAALIAGCNSKNSVTISGNITNPKGKYLKLWRVDVNVPSLTDSAKISSGGSFRFRFKASDPEFYQMGYSPSEFVTLLVKPGDEVFLRFPSANLFPEYSVKGSPDSDMIRELETRLAGTRKALDSLRIVYETAVSEKAPEKVLTTTEEEITRVVNEQRNHNIGFVLDNLNSLVSIIAIYQRFNDESYVLYHNRDLQIMKLLSDTLSARYPKSRQVRALTEDFRRELNSMNMRRFEAIAQAAEPTVLNPDLVNTEGRRISLSSLKGKYVLLTFWSAASQDCISNNLQLKEYYRMYNKKGLEIYQINLDENEEIWRNAVKFDELPWISVREDDPSNPKYMYIYNVKQVPANYLYDRSGEIIGSNLFGKALAIKLEQLFGS